MPEEIAVIASPAGTAVAPTRTNPAIDLAQSLSGVNEAIPQLFGRWAEQRQRSEAAQAQMDALQLSGQALGDAVRDGRLERTQNPWYIRAYETTAGASRGHAQVSALLSGAPQWEEYNNPAAFAARLDREIGQIGQGFHGPDQIEGFMSAAQPLRQQTLNANVAHNVNRIRSEHVMHTGQVITDAVLAQVAENPTITAPVVTVRAAALEPDGTPRPPPPPGEEAPQAPGRTLAPSTFTAPVAGFNPRMVTSGVGSRRRPTRGASTDHGGIDIGVPRGTRVGAAASGVVEFSGPRGGYGQTVIVRHPDGSHTLYAHLDRRTVEQGQTIEVGAQLGLSGSTGVSTGPHLHFGYTDARGRRRDPRQLIGSTVPGGPGGSDAPAAQAEVAPDANPRPTPEPGQGRVPANAQAIYAALEPMRENWLHTGGTEAEWNSMVANGVIAAGQRTGRADILDILNYDQGNGRGAISSIVGPNGSSMASEINQQRYYIEAAAERESTRVVREREAALDRAGDDGRRGLWGQYGQSILSGNFSTEQALTWLQSPEGGNHSPQEAARAVALLGRELDGTNTLASANLRRHTTGPGANDALELLARARRDGFSDALATDINRAVILGRIDVGDAASYYAAAQATDNAREADARQAVQDQRAAENHAYTVQQRTSQARAWGNTRTRVTTGLLGEVISRVQAPGGRPVNARDRQALRDRMLGALNTAADANPADTEAGYQAARRAAAEWVTQRLQGGAARRATPGPAPGLQAGNPRRAQ